MATEVKLPELGEGVTEGELIKWLVKPGDAVKADQPIAEVMTDKATVEVPTPVAGTVGELKFKSGDVIKVDAVMITLNGSGAATASAATAKTASAPAPQAAAASSAAKPAASSNGSGTTTPVKLPELGEGVTEGELVKWLVKPGDTVKADQPVAEVMTDKATVEVPTPVAGIVKEVKFKSGDVVKVDSVMLILEGGSGVPAKSPSPAATAASSSGATLQRAPAKPASLDLSSGAGIHPPVADLKVLATPSTRRLAREMGVDLNVLSGTGLAGRVTREDVLSVKGPSMGAGATRAGAAVPSSTQFRGTPTPLTSQGAEERVPLIGIRRKIAENLQKSKAIIPHFTLMDEANVTDLVALRESLKDYAEKNGTKITYLPIVMKAMIATIREFPMFNASIDDAASEIVYKKYFNVGFAADTPNGLVVPVIKNADQKTIIELSKEILDLSKRARDGKLKPDEMKGAGITITNIGSIGGTYATPVINHPEVAILGMYKIDEKPVIKNGQLSSIKVMNYTVTADHRLIDGAVAARFLKAFIERMENPGRLMMDMV
jgi:pyruvate dehydrogenase E2 component (dihydrolipoamide acetyltransferase)